LRRRNGARAGRPRVRRRRNTGDGDVNPRDGYVGRHDDRWNHRHDWDDHGNQRFDERYDRLRLDGFHRDDRRHRHDDRREHADGRQHADGRHDDGRNDDRRHHHAGGDRRQQDGHVLDRDAGRHHGIDHDDVDDHCGDDDRRLDERNVRDADADAGGDDAHARACDVDDTVGRSDGTV
jgi:hypothetical protein